MEKDQQQQPEAPAEINTFFAHKRGCSLSGQPLLVRGRMLSAPTDPPWFRGLSGERNGVCGKVCLRIGSSHL